MKIGVLTDIHFGSDICDVRRRTIADMLLLRAVHRLNRFVRPDVTLVLGDVVDRGEASDASDRRRVLRAFLDNLKSPWIAIPGNHDGDADAFYKDFPRPGEVVDLAGVRFLPFLDREEPGYNASRTASDIARFAAARSNFAGPIVALQHCCLAPPGLSHDPYNYLNAPEIIAAMRRHGVMLSVSGHNHDGGDPIVDGGVTFVTAPGLCVSPFSFLLITLENGRAAIQREDLAMPPSLGLVDWHVHTPLAYCSENMSIPRAMELGRAFGLAGIGFSEHSGHLYYDAKKYWNGTCLRKGIQGADPKENRTAAFFDIARSAAGPFVKMGLEVDADFSGQMVLRPEDRSKTDYLIGAIHDLPGLRDPDCPAAKLEEDFLRILDRFLGQGVQILAHPFRLFRRRNRPVPESLFAPTVALLRRRGTAAEINFHANEPSAAFFRQCINEGVRLSFGSDAHNLYEIGDFAPHLRLLREAGHAGDPRDVLLTFDGEKQR